MRRGVSVHERHRAYTIVYVLNLLEQRKLLNVSDPGLMQGINVARTSCFEMRVVRSQVLR